MHEQDECSYQFRVETCTVTLWLPTMGLRIDQLDAFSCSRRLKAGEPPECHLLYKETLETTRIFAKVVFCVISVVIIHWLTDWLTHFMDICVSLIAKSICSLIFLIKLLCMYMSLHQWRTFRAKYPSTRNSTIYYDTIDCQFNLPNISRKHSKDAHLCQAAILYFDKCHKLCQKYFSDWQSCWRYLEPQLSWYNWKIWPWTVTLTSESWLNILCQTSWNQTCSFRESTNKRTNQPTNKPTKRVMTEVTIKKRIKTYEMNPLLNLLHSGVARNL